MRMCAQVLFGGEVDPSDKGHAGAGQFSNDTFCLDPVRRTTTNAIKSVLL